MKSKNKREYILWFMCCIICTIVFAVPLLYSFANSLRSVYEGSVMGLPKVLHWENYKYAVTLIPFFRYLGSSCIIVAITVFFGVTVDFVYGYAFARLKAKGKQALFMVLLAQMMIPGCAISIPQYIAFSNFGIKDTYWIWILTGMAGSAFTIFQYKQYIEGITKEIEEAAFVDGCGFFRIITQIYVPICRNIIEIGMFSHLTTAWGDYMTPFMYLTERKYPLSIALFNQAYLLPNDPSANVEPIKLAAGILFALVPVTAFFLCQKQLVSGVTAGAVKG
jgi:multiple sugar transport system permease protein